MQDCKATEVRRMMTNPRPVPAEPVENLGGGNTRDANGVERYRGWSLDEAVSAAVLCGSLGAWEWLQDWYNAELEGDKYGPEDY